ncbi:hypothetical protein [Serratia sp. UGAL515B_01]|uniref:hypothetical protein n=1 Tax=Serratia sp. UGAL515B_01 TaxID=2986763 RepID=UPI0029553C66|nr:hypothetical protein [Serratia sp. UGAL515B_01]WON77537.1 hypothetical protein OK023_02190 [Serratia sp. UGAL515B_01]
MNKVKTFSVNTFDAWQQTEGDNPSGAYVKYEDYASLNEKCEALTKALKHAIPWLPSVDDELDALIYAAIGHEVTGEGTIVGDNGDPDYHGLIAHCAEYPEEGAIPLEEAKHE